MGNEKKWYVYLLCDPDTQEPFYVGKGTGNRINTHEMLLPHDCNPTKQQIIKDILAQGKQVLKKKIAEFDNERDAYLYEWGLINAYDGQITNAGTGGGGKISRPREKKRPSTNNELLTRAEAAERLGVTGRTIDRWREQGVLEEVLIGTHKVMIKLSSIERFLQKSQDRQLSAAS